MRESTRQQSGVVNCLRAAEGGIVPVAQIVKYLWGDRHNGGPAYAENLVRIRIWELRKMHFPIRSAWGQGYRFVPDPQPVSCGSAE